MKREHEKGKMNFSLFDFSLFTLQPNKLDHTFGKYNTIDFDLRTLLDISAQDI